MSESRLSVRVDPEKCCGFGNCWASTPEIFQIDDSGTAHVTSEVVPEHLEERVRYAEARCPQQAIEVWEIATQNRTAG